MTLVFGLECHEGCKVAANIIHGFDCSSSGMGLEVKLSKKKSLLYIVTSIVLELGAKTGMVCALKSDTKPSFAYTKKAEINRKAHMSTNPGSKDCSLNKANSVSALYVENFLHGLYKRFGWVT